MTGWRGRLFNWKFEDALKQLPELHDIREHDDFTTLDALAKMFGNAGHFDGHMAALVFTAVDAILGRWKE